MSTSHDDAVAHPRGSRSESTDESIDKPTTESTGESTDEPTTESAGESTEKSTNESTDKLTGEPVVDRTNGEPPELLKLLDDEYAQRILTLLAAEPHRGRELSERCAFSRPTVYRRLNRLEDAGLVRSELRLDPDGNHCKEFALAREALRITFDDGAITVSTHTETVEDSP